MRTLYASVVPTMGATMTTSDDHTSASFGGAAAVARSMELLWGTKPPPGRGRRPGLTLGTVVAAAIEVADAEGLDGLSMRRVADALGVGTMSLYRYVPSKAELHDLMLDSVIGEHSLDLGPDWRAGLERYARDSLAGYLRHPWLLRASLTRGAMGPNQAAALDAVLAVLEPAGLSDGERMAVVEMVTGYVRGVAQGRVDAIAAQRRSGLSDEQFWTAYAPLIDPLLDPDRFPALSRVWRGLETGWADPFEFGLARVLAGIDDLVRAR